MKLELLSPAKNLDSGKAAINAGADAVYIAAQKFGARHAASNSHDDIGQLIRYAHLYNAKVYLALNTILKNEELEEAKTIIEQQYEAGVDAVIIQDMGLLEMDLPPVPLFASTQVDNRSIEKIQFLEKAGIQRVILARELSLPQIKTIREATTIELEFFVHGALCVCFSGQCYMSQATSGRSANRGECAQNCRLTYDLQDKNFNTLLERKHLLSLHDLNLSEHLPELASSGVSSFKIEGRMKDINYVTNITAYYRQKLDALINGGHTYKRASSGKSVYTFDPLPERSFNRGFTNYFIHGRKGLVANTDTPKSVGQYVGKVTAVGFNWFEADMAVELHNNDGLCFYTRKQELKGIKVNTVEGRKITASSLSELEKGAELYRNYDHAFEMQIVKQDSALRKISCSMELSYYGQGVSLKVSDEDGTKVIVEKQMQIEPARNADKQIVSLVENLKKSGATIFTVTDVLINMKEICFMPASVINDIRRDALQQLEEKRIRNYTPMRVALEKTSHPYHTADLSYNGNVYNNMAENFYKRHGVVSIEPAYEFREMKKNDMLMETAHCIKYHYGQCKRFNDTTDKEVWREPLYLVRGHEQFKLSFDCAQCVMHIRRNA